MYKPTHIVRLTHSFSHQDAFRIYQAAVSRAGRQLILIDLSGVRDATTAAFARLVLLRRELLRLGGDLMIAGLGHRAADVFEVNRLGSVLPRQEGSWKMPHAFAPACVA